MRWNPFHRDWYRTHQYELDAPLIDPSTIPTNMQQTWDPVGECYVLIHRSPKKPPIAWYTDDIPVIHHPMDENKDVEVVVPEEEEVSPEKEIPENEEVTEPETI